MRQTNKYLVAMSIAVLLVVAVVSQLVFAADPMDTDANRLGVAPMGPMTEPAPSYDNQHTAVPGPPVQPTAASRPASWPGGSIPANQLVNQYPSTLATPNSPVELFEGTTIIARVGSEAIFAYEVMGASIVWKNGKKSEGVVCGIMGGINEILEQYKDKIPPSQFDIQRTMLIKQRLMSRIESKIIYLDAKQNFPADHFPEIEKQLTKFFESAGLPALLKCSGVESQRELDQKLQSLGSSLDRAKKGFLEWVLVQQWVGQQIKRNEEITYDQMLKYYKEHQSEFEKPAQAKWEEITVQFSKYPGKAEAYEAIARLGNQVLSGTAFAEAAKNGSQGATASEGGAHDWTTKGSLVCEELDNAIFKLPVNRLSKIIESEKGYHIIRVSERIESDVAKFLTAQVDIKEKIIQERTNKQLQEYLSRLEDKIPIWTIYDGDRKNLRLADRMKELR